MTPVYFTDRDLGKQFPDILRAAGLTVERHTDHFAHDTADEDWLQAIGQRGWVAITHDGRIRYKTNEREAVLRHNVSLLVIVGKVKYSELASAFIATEPKVRDFVAKTNPPFIAKVYRGAVSATNAVYSPGRIERWFP